MPILQTGVTLPVAISGGQTLVIKDLSGISTVTGSSAPREDASASIGAGFVVYGPHSGPATLSLTTTGICEWRIVSGDATPVPGLGVVASKCVAPSNSNTTNRQIMSRTAHIALEKITQLQVAWANWYVSANNTGELTAAGTLTLTAAIEYPLGTIAGVFKWGGNSTVSMAASTTSLTDALDGLNIPAGALFAIRSYAVGTSGIVFTGEGAGNSVGCATFAVSGVSDLTQVGGSFTDTQAGIAYRPVAILAPTTSPTLALVGDSRPQGLNDLASDIYGGRGIFERAINKQFGCIRLAASGERLQTVLVANGATNYANRKALIDAYCTHIVSDYGINDLNSGGRTAAELTTDVQSFVTLMGKPTIWSTLEPLATSSDSFATTANQTTNATVNPKRVTFNASIRNGAAGISGFLEIADAVEDTRDLGKWKVDGTASKWTSDGTHESQFACQFIEASTHIFRPLNLIR